MGEPSKSVEQVALSAEVRSRCISVIVGGVPYGLPLEEVQEVIGIRPLTRVFHAPEAMAGVTSLRGEVLAVLDLAVLLGASPAPVSAAKSARIVVVREKSGPRRRAGLRVDELGGLRDVPAEGLTPPPPTLSEAARDLVVGVIADTPPCSVLNVSAVLGSPKLAELAGSEAGNDG